MKKWILLFVICVALVLGACGTNGAKEEPENSTQDKEGAEEIADTETPAGDQEEQSETSAAEEGEELEESWEDPDIGKITILGAGYNPEADTIGMDEPLKSIEAGPMKLDIMNVLVFEVEPNEDAKTLFFDEKDKARTIIMEMKVENTSDQDVTFDPNLSVIVTDTGEQVEPDMFMMGDQGGDFLGKVKKEGQTWWLLNDLEKDVKSVKMVIPSPYKTEDLEDLAEEQRVEFEILPFEELKRFDKEIAK